VPTAANSISKSSRKGQLGDKKTKTTTKKRLKAIEMKCRRVLRRGAFIQAESLCIVSGNAWYVGMEGGGREEVPCVELSFFKRHFRRDWCVFL